MSMVTSIRAPDPEDGRASFAVLPSAGGAALRHAAPVYLGGIRRHFTDHLDPAERDQLRRMLDKIVTAHQGALNRFRVR